MSATMGGWRTHVARAFVACFMYGVLPMCAVFSLVSGLSLSVYSFKLFLFLVKGDFSIAPNSTATTTAGHIVASLIVSPLELLIAALFMVVSAVVYYFYTRFIDARRREEKQHERALRADAKRRNRHGGGGGSGSDVLNVGPVAEDFNLVLDL